MPSGARPVTRKSFGAPKPFHHFPDLAASLRAARADGEMSVLSTLEDLWRMPGFLRNPDRYRGAEGGAPLGNTFDSCPPPDPALARTGTGNEHFSGVRRSQ
jgi:hypothetical protein